METAGARPVSELKRALTPRGTLVIVGGEGGGKWVGKAGGMVQAPMMSPVVSQKLTTLAVKHNSADLIVRERMDLAGVAVPILYIAWSAWLLAMSSIALVA